MEFQEGIRRAYQKKWPIFWLTALGAVLAFDAMVIQPPEYKASSRVLVIQKQVAGQDIYSISKAAQYLGQILKEGINSDSFFEKVLSSSYQIEATDFPFSIKERRQEWQKNVKTRIVRDLGLMEIDVFSSEREKAEKLSWAITDTLEKNHQLYHGADKNVELKVLDYPLVSQKPVTSRLWLGSILGALVGFFSGLSWALGKKPQKEISSLDGSESSI